MLKNIPTKASGILIKGAIKEDNSTIEIFNEDGHLIEWIPFNREHPELLAQTIALLITEARDVGYKQCQVAIQRALGVS